MEKYEILKELSHKQRRNIIPSKKLQYTDLKRITKYLDNSIFNRNRCSLWKGSVTNINNSKRGIYINFYFRGKKCALHRLLYINFVDDLKNYEYLKYNCENKGSCCNINHFYKVVRRRRLGTIKKQIESNSSSSNSSEKYKIKI